MRAVEWWGGVEVLEWREWGGVGRRSRGSRRYRDRTSTCQSRSKPRHSKNRETILAAKSRLLLRLSAPAFCILNPGALAVTTAEHGILQLQIGVDDAAGMQGLDASGKWLLGVARLEFRFL